MLIRVVVVVVVQICWLRPPLIPAGQAEKALLLFVTPTLLVQRQPQPEAQQLL
jgi:hypothetical protein